MKTGIVMEISKGKAILLTKEGTFVTYRIPKGKQPKIGQEYAFDFFRDPYRFQFLFPSFSISLAAVLMFILYHGSIPLSRAETVAAYISFDINPSLEVAVDQDLRILNVTAFNEDGKEAVERIGNVKGFTLPEFTDKLINDYEHQGYLSRDRELMIMTAQTKEISAAAQRQIEQSVKTIAQKTRKLYQVKVSSGSAALKTRNEAKKKGITAGKFSLYLNAKKKNHTITVKQAGKMTVSQLKNEATRVNKHKNETGKIVSAVSITPLKVKPANNADSPKIKKIIHKQEKPSSHKKKSLKPQQNNQKKDKNLHKKSIIKVKGNPSMQPEKGKRSDRTHENKAKGQKKHKEKSVR